MKNRTVITRFRIPTYLYMFLLFVSLGAHSQSIPMINFENKQEISQWQIVNDTVMGGRSRAGMEIIDGSAFFYGIVSLRNNGGFASVRRPIELPKLSKNAQVRLRVVGDGKRYQLRFRMNGNFDGVSYSATFKTQKGEASEHVFSLADFEAGFRGRRVTDAPELVWSQVQQLALMISSQQEGEFKLLVDSIVWFDKA